MADSDARRQPALEGARNFRDLGGYRSLDGRRVRWGQLYRSGALADLTVAGQEQVAALGIRTALDFRSPAERRREPSPWDVGSVATLHWDYDFGDVSLRGILAASSDFSVAGMRAAMLELYRRLPDLFAAPYAGLFEQLAHGQLPLVFHCAAGKDRTGVAAALVLASLEIPHATIISDYTLTNTAIDLETVLARRWRNSIGVANDHAHLSQITPEVRRPLLEARPEYLQAALEQMQSAHGSLQGYLAERLGVSTEALREIRARLLEP